MWQDMFSLSLPVAEKVLRTVLIYALIVILFRFTGKRSIASMNTLDFVVVFLLSNVVQNSIIGNDNSVTGGIIGAVTLVVVNDLVDRLAFSVPWVRALLEGTATTIIREGHVQSKRLRRLGIRKAELDHAVRMQNGDDVAEVWTGVLEPGGQLVLTLRKSEQSASTGDIAELNSRLDRIEQLLAARA